MTASPQLNRRSLLVSAAAIGGGLSLGLRIPFGLAGAQAADSVPEVNAWVVIRPDDTVVIRIRFEPSVPRDTTNLSSRLWLVPANRKSQRKRTDTRNVGPFPRGTDGSNQAKSLARQRLRGGDDASRRPDYSFGD